jgi:hypothetical protein
MPIAQTAEDFGSRSRERVIASIESQLMNTYIDLPIAERMSAVLTAHQQAGDYDRITDPYSFALRLTKTSKPSARTGICMKSSLLFLN